MSVHVALLRGINVGTRNRVKMAELRAIFAAAGCADVRTLLQSGNVLFDLPQHKLKAAVANVETELEAMLGNRIAVITRPLSTMRALIEAQPFGPTEPRDDEQWYVTSLATSSRKRLELPLTSADGGLTLIARRRSEVLSVLKRVDRRQSYPNEIVEQRLGVPATTRNWNTIRRLLAMADGG